MKSQVIGFLLFVLGHVNRIEAFGGGAPLSRCPSMEPDHGPPAQTSASPYTIIIDEDNYYMAGQMKNITVKSSDGRSLTGLICQMRKATETTVAVGTFSLMENEANLRLLACGGQEDSGVTHSVRSHKAMAEFYWMAPADMGTVKVMCTVVETFRVFWMQVLSEPLMYGIDPDVSTPRMMESTMSTDRTTMSTDRTTMSTDHTTMSTDRTTMSTDRTTTTDRTTMSTDRTTISTDPTTMSIDRTMMSTDRTTMSTDPTTMSTDRTTTTDRTTMSTDRTTMSTDRTTMTTDRSTMNQDGNIQDMNGSSLITGNPLMLVVSVSVIQIVLVRRLLKE